jgi:hypothetical protein
MVPPITTFNEPRISDLSGFFLSTIATELG